MANNKLVLKKIRAKNFRSIGNQFIELDYRASMSTLIASENNGSGKSTLSIWALYYALFGKPYKKGAKIASLVNSRSNKDCVVEAEFDTLGSQWKVVRGYKPAIFEIYQDDKLIENEAALKDMQKYLQGVISMDDSAFSNTVALGIDRFVPFVEMAPDQRRLFVEQMLDMVVISQMNEQTKSDAKIVKTQISQLDYDISMLDSKLKGRERTLAILVDKQNKRLTESGSELGTQELEATKIRGMITTSATKITSLEGTIAQDAVSNLNKINLMMTQFRNKGEELKRQSTSITVLTDCPTCKQCVSEEHKAAIEQKLTDDLATLVEPMRKLYEARIKAQEVVDSNIAIHGNIDKIREIKHSLEIKLGGLDSTIKKIKDSMVDNDEQSLIDIENQEIVNISTSIDTKYVEMKELKAKSSRYDQLLQVLKDDGIKANIVSQYLPFLNQNINHLLDQMNLYVQINIDSEFNVSIFAPDRKGQTLDNLSTGQIRRVDLACMLAWRNIAKNKASVDCNVLILDEILENLSSSGVEEFMEMWQTIGQDVNLFVVSQRETEFSQYFDNLIKYKLVNDMTVAV